MSMKRERSGALWAVGVIGVLLAGLGLCGGGSGLVMTIVQEPLVRAQQDLVRQTERDPERLERQLEVQERGLEIGRRFKIATITTGVLNLIVSLALLVGAILLFTWNPRGPSIFVAVAAASLVADAIYGGVGGYISYSTTAQMQEVMLQDVQQGQEQLAGGILRASSTMGLCMAATWFLAKAAYYVSSIIYLRKGTVRALFE